MLTLTINGIACDPSLCRVVDPSGQWTVNADVTSGVFSSGPEFDTHFQAQSLSPIGNGGHIVIVATLDADAATVATNIGGNGLPFINAKAEIVGSKIVETIVIDLPRNALAGADFDASWTAKPPAQCIAPLVGIPPDCYPGNQQPIPAVSSAGLLAMAVAVCVVAWFCRRFG